MRILVAILLLVIAAPLAPPIHAQTNLGTDFWLADTPNAVSLDPFAIVVANTSGTAANVMVWNRIEGSTTATISAHESMTFRFRRHPVFTEGIAISTDPSYHVTSDIPVSVFAFVPLGDSGTTDATLVLPTRALGRSYTVANYVDASLSTSGPFVGVVATSPGTTNVVLVDASGGVVSNRDLRQGEYFQRASHPFSGGPSEDMTGWRVLSDKPTAAFSGNVATVILSSCCADHLMEQLLPEDTASLTYVVCPSRTRPLSCGTSCAVDLFRFAAVEDATSVVTAPDVGGGFINEGHFIQVITDTPFVVTADKPLMGFQYLTSFGASFGSRPRPDIGDPALVGLVPIERFRSDYVFVSPGEYQNNFINFVLPAGTNLVLDGNPISATCDSAGSVDGTDYCCGRMAIAAGMHTVSGDRRFGLMVSGFGSLQDGYAYIGGLDNLPRASITVSIDIKPGSDINAINLSSAGVVPVAILSSASFDARSVNPETIGLAGAQVRLAGKSGSYLCQERDTNADSLIDLVCDVKTDQFLIEPGESQAVLDAITFDGMAIRGEDSVRIVPD